MARTDGDSYVDPTMGMVILKTTEGGETGRDLMAR